MRILCCLLRVSLVCALLIVVCCWCCVRGRVLFAVCCVLRVVCCLLVVLGCPGCDASYLMYDVA